jgi:short-subunit dehydrogenase
MKKKNKLFIAEEGRWVLIHGACTKVGKLSSKVFASNNYSLILVDTDLSKLQ